MSHIVHWKRVYRSSYISTMWMNSLVPSSTYLSALLKRWEEAVTRLLHLHREGHPRRPPHV